MKKLLLPVIVLCMIFGFTSCGNDDKKPSTEQDLDNWTEKDLEDALNELDSAKGSSGASDQEPAVPPVDSFEAKQEILDAAWDSGLVQIDDKLIQLPVRLNELVDMGLDYEIASGNKSKDFLFTQNETISLNVTYKGVQLSSLVFTKETEAPETVKDINPLIDKISVLSKPETITMYFPGGLTFDAPYASAEEKLGKATEVDSNLTCKYGQLGSAQTDMQYGINVRVDRNTQVLSGFEVGKSIHESDRNSLTAISFENVPNTQTSDIHNVSLLWAPEYKTIPGMLKSERRVDSVLNDSGKRYYISLSFTMLAQKYASPFDYIEYGEPILDTAGENGVSRKVYNTGHTYVVVCSTDVNIFKGTISCKNMSDSSEDALAALQELVFQIAESVQF